MFMVELGCMLLSLFECCGCVKVLRCRCVVLGCGVISLILWFMCCCWILLM